jgi:hypothetical protein
MPKRVQLRRTKDWRLSPFARSVARPSYYGNPYKPGSVYLVGDLLPFPLPTARTWEGPCGADNLRAVKCANVGEAVAWFRSWASLALEPSKVELLRGFDLACWCPLDLPCHADVLLELANPDRPGPDARTKALTPSGAAGSPPARESTDVPHAVRAGADSDPRPRSGKRGTAATAASYSPPPGVGHA